MKRKSLNVTAARIVFTQTAMGLTPVWQERLPSTRQSVKQFSRQR